jgi:hypothetical protein
MLNSLLASSGSVIPLAVAVLGGWLLIRKGRAQPLHVLTAMVLGVILAGTAVGAEISQILSQLSGGRLH